MSSVDASDDVPLSTAAELRLVIISQCRLSQDQAILIDAETRRSHLNFGDAAISLGIITQDEVDTALKWVQQVHYMRQPSLIENAIHRHRLARESTSAANDALVTPGNNLLATLDAGSPRSERVRALCTQLLLLCEGPGRVIAMVSPDAGTGQSQLTAELAISFAQLGRRTLMVDADLRRPRLHSFFNADNEPGLAQSLALKQLPRPSGVEGLRKLSLVTAGAPVQNPLELLSDRWFGRLIAEWRSAYDFVLMDTPPLGEFSDALTIAKTAGHVLVVCRSDITAYSTMKEMLRRLAVTHSETLGAVLNRF